MTGGRTWGEQKTANWKHLGPGWGFITSRAIVSLPELLTHLSFVLVTLRKVDLGVEICIDLQFEIYYLFD